MPSSRRPAHETPSKPAAELLTRIRQLETELAERERELADLRVASALAEREAFLSIAAAQSDLRDLRASLRAWYARRLTRIIYVLDDARATVAPWGTLRGQAAGYTRSAASMAVGAVAHLGRRVGAPILSPRLPASTAARTAPAAAGEAAASPAAFQTGAPLVSVVIPVYNAERANGRFLTQALESVAGQTYQAFEIIVVDDGSTDGSAGVVERFIASHSNLAVRLISKDNGGQSSARNLGAQSARGEWLAFLDQDDLWVPTHLQVVRPHLIDGVGLVYTDADIIDENDAVRFDGIHARYGMGGHHPKTGLEDVLYEDICVMPGVMTIRRSLFEQLGGFDERLSGCEDDDLFLRAMQAGHIIYVPVATLKWRYYTDSYGLSRRMIDSRLVYWQKLIRDYADDGRDRVRARRISLRFLYVFLVEGATRLNDDRPLTADYLAAALELLPYVGPLDRASFALVEWAWRSHSRMGFYARTWFLHGLEPAQPKLHELVPPAELATR